jgi:zinc transport system permease protein
MHEMFALFLLPPVAKGLCAMAVAGLCFPAAGVMVLRLDLIPMRYMLMHGVILGGALALALSVPILPVTIAINLLLVLAMMRMAGDTSQGFGVSSAAAMVFTMALASMIMQVFDVPAKDTLQLLWGSPFALSRTDILLLAGTGTALLVYILVNFRTISAMFFDQEIAQSLGMPVKAHYTAMLMLVALVIALAMKLIGALLIDALLVLPVLIAAVGSQSLKQLFFRSCLLGLLISVVGFTGAVITNLPPSGTIALLSALLFLTVSRPKKRIHT